MFPAENPRACRQVGSASKNGSPSWDIHTDTGASARKHGAGHGAPASPSLDARLRLRCESDYAESIAFAHDLPAAGPDLERLILNRQEAPEHRRVRLGVAGRFECAEVAAGA